MSRTVEVRTLRGWQRLGHDQVPTVRETETISLRGLAAGQVVRIGLTEVTADDTGDVSLRPATDQHLSGHVGLVDIADRDSYIGEVELIPHKMSEEAYRVLRAELQRLWTDLVFTDASPTTVRAGPPSARELWRRIDRPVLQILDQPSTRVEVGVEPRRVDQVRHPRELTHAVLRAGQRNRPALTRTLQRTTNTPENQLCAVTLRLLKNHAKRDPSATDVVSKIERLLRHPTLPTSSGPLRRITWGMRSDRRYSQVLAIHQLLNRPELEATEGPGELRLGVPALSRLYEYWVFLHVLAAASDLYGPPEGQGFEQLAIPVRGNRRRLEIPRGTTVTFPGPVHIAFEPNINTRGDGWMGLEYVPHPHPDRQQLAGTPDVAVLDLGASPTAPSLTIIDAKYVGRSFVEFEAARVHDKYSRMRMTGIPVVRNVLIAHPHTGFANQWAGYGHLPLTPGQPANLRCLPMPSVPPSEALERPPSGNVPPSTAPPARVTEPHFGTRELYVVADQFWMRQALAGRRIDLDAMKAVVAGNRQVQRFDLVMPRLGQLVPFGRAAEVCGWHVEWLESVDREGQISSLVELIGSHLPGAVIVVSGDRALLELLPVGRIETFQDLDRVPGL